MARKMDVFGDALATLGRDIAVVAATQEAEAESSWEQLKTMFKLAKTLGVEHEAFDNLYNAGEKVIQKKAIWYRRQKRILKTALELGVEITDKMSQREAAEAVEAARESAKSPEQREQDALRMLKRSMKGAAKVAGKDVAKRVVLKTTTPNRKPH